MYCSHFRLYRECPICTGCTGVPVNGAPASPESTTVNELPAWCRAIRYDSVTKSAGLTIALPVRDNFGRTIEQLIQLELDEAGARALGEACATVAKKFSAPPRVIDVVE